MYNFVLHANRMSATFIVVHPQRSRGFNELHRSAGPAQFQIPDLLVCRLSDTKRYPVYCCQQLGDLPGWKSPSLAVRSVPGLHINSLLECIVSWSDWLIDWHHSEYWYLTHYVTKQCMSPLRCDINIVDVHSANWWRWTDIADLHMTLPSHSQNVASLTTTTRIRTLFVASHALSIDAAYCYISSTLSGLSVGRTGEPCKNSWTDRDAVWVADSRGPKEPMF